MWHHKCNIPNVTSQLWIQANNIMGRGTTQTQWNVIGKDLNLNSYIRHRQIKNHWKMGKRVCPKHFPLLWPLPFSPSKWIRFHIATMRSNGPNVDRSVWKMAPISTSAGTPQETTLLYKMRWVRKTGTKDNCRWVLSFFWSAVIYRQNKPFKVY